MTVVKMNIMTITKTILDVQPASPNLIMILNYLTEGKTVRRLSTVTDTFTMPKFRVIECKAKIAYAFPRRGRQSSMITPSSSGA